MILKDREYVDLRDKLNKIAAPHQCILKRSGIFEVNLLDDTDASSILRKLKETNFIQDVNKLQTNKYDFGHFDFSSGKAEPQKFYTVRGIVKEPVVDEAADMEEDYGNREKWIDIIRSYGKEYNFNNYTDAQLYAIAYKLQEYEPKKKPEHRRQLDLFDADKYNKKPEQDLFQQELDRQELARNEKEFDVNKAKSVKYCDKCGTQLNDAGECPLCDLGDDSVLDEAVNILEDIEKHDTLNPLLWNDDNTLKPEVKEKVIEIAHDFMDALKEDEIKFKLKDIRLVGSNCSYNYNRDSDLDLHLVADTKSLECPDNLYPVLYSAYRSIWNKNHDISFYGIPVEIFVETPTEDDELNEAFDLSRPEGFKADGENQEFIRWEHKYYIADPKKVEKYINAQPIENVKQENARDGITTIYRIYKDNKLEYEFIYTGRDSKHPYPFVLCDRIFKEELNEAKKQSALKSNGIYSVLKDKWIKEPVQEDIPEIDMNEFNKKFQTWEDRYFETKENPSVDSIEKYINDIYDLRQKSIKDEGEYGFGNLIFKEARARGYLDDLRDLKIELRNKELSLESLEENKDLEK